LARLFARIVSPVWKRKNAGVPSARKLCAPMMGNVPTLGIVRGVLGMMKFVMGCMTAVSGIRVATVGCKRARLVTS